MNSNKKYCLFPKPHFNHFLFLFYFVSAMVKQYIFKGTKKINNLSVPIFKLYIFNIGDFLSIIPYLILKEKTKSNNNKLIKNNILKKYIHPDIFKKKKKQIIINIFIMCLFDFIGQTSTTIFYLIEGNQKIQVKHANLNIVLIFNIIFLFLLSKFILNMILYLHHYLSFIIYIICLIVISIIDFTEIESKDSINSLLYMTIRVFSVLLYSIVNNIAKIMFFKYYYSPYLLLLIKAIIHFFFLIIFSIPLIFVKFKDENEQEKIIFSMIGNIFKDNKIIILFYIIYLISSFFYNILNFIIIDKFSPTHTAIAFISENFAIFIINAITSDTKIDYKFGIRFVMYILLIIASCIFNEFLVINICSLANNTKLFLDNKEKNDLILIDEINNEQNMELYEDNDEENFRPSSIGDSLKSVELSEL